MDSDMSFKMADMNFLMHCVDWIRNASLKQEIYVDIHVGDFKLVFENKEKMRKNRTPSQLRRDNIRHNKFKASVDGSVHENNNFEGYDVDPHTLMTTKDCFEMPKMQFDLLIDANENVKNFDVIEAIEENFNGCLDDRKVNYDDPCRNIFIHKLKQIGYQRNDKVKMNQFIYRVYVEKNDTAGGVITDWQNPCNFDDLAFRNSVIDKVQVKVREVRQIK